MPAPVSSNREGYTHLVVRGVDENFVYNLEETRNVLDLPVNHALVLRVPGPHVRDNRLHASNIGIRSLENVL